MATCKKCGGIKCTSKKSIHELAKANPDKSYREVEQERAEQSTYEQHSNTNTGGLVIDDTNDCEWCQ